MFNILLFLAGVITLIGIYSILTLAVNMHYGYAGLNSFGIVGFMAIGAYTYTILTIGPPHGDNFYQIGFSFPWWVGLIGAGVVTTIFAFIIALPTLRVEGDYLLVVTFAFSEIIQKLLANESWLTNGTRGFMQIQQPFRSAIPGQSYQFFLAGLVVLIVAICYLVAQHVGASPFGRTLRALRDNEPVALSAGKNVYSFKMRIFLLGVIMIGVAGAMYTWYMSIAVPPLFGMEVTFAAWIALVIGGQGNNKGAIVGTIVLLGAQQALKFIQLTVDLAPMISAMQMIIEGLVLVLILRFYPAGLIPEKSPRPPKLPQVKVEARPVKEGA